MTVRHLSPEELALFDKAVADSLGATVSTPSRLPEYEAALRRAHVTRPTHPVADGYVPHPNAEALAAKVYAIQSEGCCPTPEEAREIERLIADPTGEADAAS